MSGLDGIYRHHGATTHWDGSGVTLSREGRVARVDWEDILGVRQLGDRPGYIQLIVNGHVPAPRLSEDHFTIPVNSDADANRLSVSLGWQARGHGIGTDDAL
jgi:hypothetical protein